MTRYLPYLRYLLRNAPSIMAIPPHDITSQILFLLPHLPHLSYLSQLSSSIPSTSTHPFCCADWISNQPEGNYLTLSRTPDPAPAKSHTHLPATNGTSPSPTFAGRPTNQSVARDQLSTQRGRQVTTYPYSCLTVEFKPPLLP